MAFLWPLLWKPLCLSHPESCHTGKVCLLTDFLIPRLQGVKEAPYRCQLPPLLMQSCSLSKATLWIRPWPRLPDTQIWLRLVKQQRHECRVCVCVWRGGLGIWRCSRPQGFIKVWGSSNVGLILSLGFEAPNANATFASTDLREHSAIKPRLHLQYAPTQTDVTITISPVSGHILFPTAGPPPLPSPPLASPPLRTSSMTMQLQPAGTSRAGCRRSPQWKSAWCLALFHFPRIQMELKPPRGRCCRFQKRAHIWDVALPLINTRLLCSVCACIGCHRSVRLYLGCFSVSPFVALKKKTPQRLNDFNVSMRQTKAC